MQDEAVAHFVLVTGADAKTAEGLIEVCLVHTYVAKRMFNFVAVKLYA